ncbi:MAG: homogentisate 1,2-dioxygenase, partial [Planctomycetota bacterium]
INIPKGTLYHMEWEMDEEKSNKMVVVESTTPFEIPRHYITESGQLAEDAPYWERDLRPPEYEEPKRAEGEFKLHIQAGWRNFEYTLDHHPLDVVGWDGFLYPYILNIRDFSPKVGKIHLPPPVHLVFQTQSFVYCNFCPRLFDFHPEAIPAPYVHHNVDSDEVLYYVEGNFMSRKGVEEGSITLHPTGIPHGPQPGKTEESIGKKETLEYALMVDTFAPLSPTLEAQKVQDETYFRSWLTDNPLLG